MREITSHIVANDPAQQLKIRSIDEAGAGGAYHHYQIIGFDSAKNPVAAGPADAGCTILFQNGTIASAGVNGVTIEALLAVCKDRLECFQDGPFPSTYNANALHGVNEALLSLQKRTIDRINRGVEGKLES